jgi:hypothetical protein
MFNPDEYAREHFDFVREGKKEHFKYLAYLRLKLIFPPLGFHEFLEEAVFTPSELEHLADSSSPENELSFKWKDRKYRFYPKVKRRPSNELYVTFKKAIWDKDSNMIRLEDEYFLVFDLITYNQRLEQEDKEKRKLFSSMEEADIERDQYIQKLRDQNDRKLDEAISNVEEIIDDSEDIRKWWKFW